METQLERRKFIGTAAAALFAGVAIQIFGCSTDDGYGNGPGGAGGKTGVVGANHGHSAVITGAQLEAGGAVTLNIAGSAGHNHTVPLTSEQVTAIRAGTMVSQLSSETGAHSHLVTFN